MNLRLQITLIGVFGGAGVGLALCLGMTSGPTNGPPHESVPGVAFVHDGPTEMPGSSQGDARAAPRESPPVARLRSVSVPWGGAADEKPKPRNPLAERPLPPNPAVVAGADMSKVAKAKIEPPRSQLAQPTHRLGPTAPALANSEAQKRDRPWMRGHQMRGLELPRPVPGSVAGKRNDAPRPDEQRLSIRMRESPASSGLEPRRAVAVSSSGIHSEDAAVVRRSYEEFLELRRPLDTSGTRVYRPKHINPAELQRLVQPLLTGAGSAQIVQQIELGGPGPAGQADRPAVILRDSVTALNQVDQVMPLIDTRPPHVVVDAMVVSVRLTDANSAGADFDAIRQKHSLVSPWPATPGPQGTHGGFQPGPGGLKIAYIEGSIGGLIETLEKMGQTTVVANPRLAVLSRGQAEILVGEVSGRMSAAMVPVEDAGAAALNRATQLRFRPLISGDGTVRMDLFLRPAEAKAAGGDPSAKDATSAASVAVQDGETLLVGGIIRQAAKTEPQISKYDPRALLGRKSSNQGERYECLVLLTLRVEWDSPASANAASGTPNRSPASRRSMAECYLRAAEAAGDREGAFRLVDLALRLDSLQGPAVALRDRLWTNSSSGSRQPPATVAQSRPESARRHEPAAQQSESTAIPARAAAGEPPRQKTPESDRRAGAAVPTGAVPEGQSTAPWNRDARCGRANQEADRLVPDGFGRMQ